MRKTLFGGVAATGLALGTSFANADTALLVVSNGYEGGIAIHEKTYNRDGLETCKAIAYNAAAATINVRYGSVSVTCFNEIEKMTGGFYCEKDTRKGVQCTALEPPQP